MIAVRFTPDIPFVQGKSHRWGGRRTGMTAAAEHGLEAVIGDVPRSAGAASETTL